MKAVWLILLLGFFAAPAALAEDRLSYNKDDLRGLRVRMIKGEVMAFEGVDCKFHRAGTKAQTSSVECRDRVGLADDVDLETEYNIHVEFTSSLTGSVAYLIRYKFCSVYDEFEVADEVTRQFDAKRSGMAWLFDDKDQTSVAIQRGDHAWCKSSERGWEIVMVSQLLLSTDNHRRQEWKNPDPDAPQGPDF